MSDFLPKDYKIPSTPSRYMKFQEGKNKFRILANPITGWEWWVQEGKKKSPRRTKRFADVPEFYQSEEAGRNQARHFWALKVYNYATGKVEVLEIKQKKIMAGIKNLNNNEEWGSPLGYDLIVTRTKTGAEARDVEYAVIPTPKKPLSKEVKEAAKEEIDLEALYKGSDPFKKEKAEADNLDDIPF